MPAPIACFSDCGMASDQVLAQADAGGQDEHDAGDRHAAERDLPRHVHADDHGVGEEEVVPHRRRDRDRVVREQRHQRRRERRREAGRHEHRAEVHPGRAQDRRLHEDDVRHRQERGDAGEDFGADGRAVRRELETALEEVHGRDYSARRVSERLVPEHVEAREHADRRHQHRGGDDADRRARRRTSRHGMSSA